MSFASFVPRDAMKRLADVPAPEKPFSKRGRVCSSFTLEEEALIRSGISTASVIWSMALPSEPKLSYLSKILD